METLLTADEVKIAKTVQRKELQKFLEHEPVERMMPSGTWLWFPHKLDDFCYLGEELRTSCEQQVLKSARADTLEVSRLRQAFAMSESLSSEDFLTALRLCWAYLKLSGVKRDGDRLAIMLDRLEENPGTAVQVQARLTYAINQQIRKDHGERRFLLALAYHLEQLANDQTPPLPIDVVVDHFYRRDEMVVCWAGQTPRVLQLGVVIDPQATNYHEMTVGQVENSLVEYGMPTVASVFGSDPVLRRYGQVLPWSVYEYYDSKLDLLRQHCHILGRGSHLNALLQYWEQLQVEQPEETATS